MKKLNLKILVFVILLAVISCNDKTAQDVKQKIDTGTKKIAEKVDTLVSSISKKDSLFDNIKVVTVDTSRLLPETLRSKINEIFSHYIDIKNELANNDSADVIKHAKELIESAVSAQDDVLKDIDKKWKFSPDKVQKITKQVETTNSLSKQRTMFSQLSEAMIEMVKLYGLDNKTVYLLECKKTSEGGGRWLSDSKDRSNPYFGKNENTEDCLTVKEAWEFN